MSGEVIFEITKDHLERGVRNIPVGYSASSYMDPRKGLFYSGAPLNEVAHWEPTAVIYLLMYGSRPSDYELKEFEAELSKRAFISENVLKDVASLPIKLDPLDVFSISLTFLSALEKEIKFEDQCLNAIAKLPLLVSFIINHLQGVESHLKSSNLPYLKTLIENLNLKNLKKDIFYEALKVHNILYYDHGGGAMETFAAKVVSSGGGDVYSSLVAATMGLKSDFNGKASLHSFNFLSKLKKFCDSNFSEARIEGYINQHLLTNSKLPGFGHTFFLLEDPRACIMFDFAKKWFAEHGLITMAFYLRAIGRKVLSEKTKIKNPNMNLDGISPAVLSASSFDYPEYFPLLVAMARSTGVAIQLLHERRNKKLKMMHPQYIYRAIF